MNLKLSERERWLLLALGLFVVFFIFYQYVYAPKAVENDSLKEKLRTQRLELKISKEKARLLQNLELTPLNKLREKKSKEEQVIEALGYLSGEISKSKLTMLSIRPKLNEQNVDSAKAVFMDLILSGRYNEIYKFMSALEKLPILILVDSLVMNRADSPKININIVLSVYY
ncbi:MAG: hypothetical protein FD145_895 [Candidatus Saganbacteria bacterium]|uniref:Type II secretion system protein M n=1 Tax=Candidatus Saganbacteria bacterium TaxID=2575572 RepID=A0A833L148_UNCSA|nr:MAG: hypothetical protein FD145_895 [Candidatus Saganbacteria bacterium]